MNDSGGKLSKKNKKQQQQNEESEVPELTKEETAIARYLRLSCPNKQGNLVGMKVDFFLGNKLVDCLMESKWGPGTLNPQTSKKNDAQPMLASRQACISFMQRLMNKQLFYRAVKIYKETNEKSSKDGQASDSTPNLRKRNKEKKENQPSATPVPDTATPSSSEQQQQQQQKKKFKLEMHEEQKFLDTNDPFVWVYDPTSTKTYIIGSLLILGAIGICLFPLWPSQVREGVYYLSLAGASFLGLILSLAVLKYILFALIWLVTLGKIQFWLFPNLTEDVGFFESFVPAYNCKVASAATSSSSSSSSSSPSASAQPVSTINSTDSKIISNTDENSQTLLAESNQEEAKSCETNPDECIGNEPILKEISKSTLEICKGITPKGSPSVGNKLKKKDSITNDEDGFELLEMI